MLLLNSVFPPPLSLLGGEDAVAKGISSLPPLSVFEREGWMLLLNHVLFSVGRRGC